MTFHGLFQKNMTISNMITLMRIVLIIPLVRSLASQQWGSAFLIFSIAAMSDIADGYLARILQQQTTLGMILDPVADKLLLGACYLSFIWYPNAQFTLPGWFYTVMFAKEAILLMGGAIGLTFGMSALKPTMLGKGAMFLQSIFVGMLLFSSWYGSSMMNVIGYCTVTLVTITIGAFIQYSVSAFRLMRKI